MQHKLYLPAAGHFSQANVIKKREIAQSGNNVLHSDLHRLPVYFISVGVNGLLMNHLYHQQAHIWQPAELRNWAHFQTQVGVWGSLSRKD